MMQILINLTSFEISLTVPILSSKSTRETHISTWDTLIGGRSPFYSSIVSQHKMFALEIGILATGGVLVASPALLTFAKAWAHKYQGEDVVRFSIRLLPLPTV
jgi:hypothetical protein